MEQKPEKEIIGGQIYKVLWHHDIKEDFSKIHPGLTDSVVDAAEHRLSRAPQFIGQPLKGTTNLLWRIHFGKYRIVYTMNLRAKEVWVLSVKKRDIVYRNQHVQSLLRLAVAIQQEIERGS